MGRPTRTRPRITQGAAFCTLRKFNVMRFAAGQRVLHNLGQRCPQNIPDSCKRPCRNQRTPSWSQRTAGAGNKKPPPPARARAAIEVEHVRYNDSDSCLQPPKRGYENGIYRASPMSIAPPPHPQVQKLPTDAAIGKALRILKTQYRVTLEPLPHSPPSEQQARKKEITL